MYTPLPKNIFDQLTPIMIQEDGESWTNIKAMKTMEVDNVGYALLQEGIKPKQLIRYYIRDSDNFVWQVIDQPTALWIWDNYKQAGQPEVCILSEGPFNEYTDSVVETRIEIEHLYEDQIIAVAIGYDKQLNQQQIPKSC